MDHELRQQHKYVVLELKGVVEEVMNSNCLPEHAVELKDTYAMIHFRLFELLDKIEEMNEEEIMNEIKYIDGFMQDATVELCHMLTK